MVTKLWAAGILIGNGEQQKGHSCGQVRKLSRVLRAAQP